MKGRSEPAEYFVALGHAVRIVRENKGIARTKLPNLSQATVHYIENGHTKNYSADTLALTIAALGFASEEKLLKQARKIASWANVTEQSDQAYAEKLGNAIRTVRTHQGKKQSELPDLSQTTVHCIENGDTQKYSADTLALTIAALGFDNEAALLEYAETLGEPVRVHTKDTKLTAELGNAIYIVRRHLNKTPQDIGNSDTVRKIEKGLGGVRRKTILDVIQNLGFKDEAGILAEANRIRQNLDAVLNELRSTLSALDEDLEATRQRRKNNDKQSPSATQQEQHPQRRK